MSELGVRLVASIEELARNSRFPVWLNDPDLGVTGAMRAAGFTTSSAIALVFEVVEFSPAEGVIQPLLTCISTEQVPEWIKPGEARLVAADALFAPDTGQPKADLGIINVEGRTRTFRIDASAPALLERGYPIGDHPLSVIQALTWCICDTLPADELFSSASYVRNSFALAAEARPVFDITQWHHPGVEIYEEPELEVSRYADLSVMVDTLARRSQELSLRERPNTNWRDHVLPGS